MANKLLKDLLTINNGSIEMLVNSYEDVKAVRKTFKLGATRWHYLDSYAHFPKYISITRDDSNNLQFKWSNHPFDKVISINPLDLIIEQIRSEIYE